MTLVRCRKLSGGHHPQAGKPRVTTYDEAIAFDWALYDRQRRLIPASAYYREALDGFSVIGAPPTIDLNPATIRSVSARGCYWLGVFQTHFGHFLVATLARLWAYPFGTRDRPPIAYVGPPDVMAIPYGRARRNDRRAAIQPSALHRVRQSLAPLVHPGLGAASALTCATGAPLKALRADLAFFRRWGNRSAAVRPAGIALGAAAAPGPQEASARSACGPHEEHLDPPLRLL